MKIMSTKNNQIGDRGEVVASLVLTTGYIFSCYHLGGKTPAFDLIIEISETHDSERSYQALIQVKATESDSPFKNSGIHQGDIITPVPKKKLHNLIKRPLPSYVMGVDINGSVHHLAPAFNPAISYSSGIPPKLVFDTNNKDHHLAALHRLKEDIINYWESYNMHINKPRYQSIL